MVRCCNGQLRYQGGTHQVTVSSVCLNILPSKTLDQAHTTRKTNVMYTSYILSIIQHTFSTWIWISNPQKKIVLPKDIPLHWCFGDGIRVLSNTSLTVQLG